MAGSDRGGLGSAYWRMWIASSISVLGDGVRFTAMPLVAASVTHNAIAVSLVSVAAFAPWLVFSLIAGALVDRWDRRRVMWMSDLFRTIVMGGFTAVVAFGHASIAIIVVASFALGMAETLFDNASQTILPAVVPKEHLARANSRLYAGQIIGMQFVGPPLGGLLFAGLIWAPFSVDATSFLIASLLVLSCAVGSGSHARRARRRQSCLRRSVKACAGCGVIACCVRSARCSASGTSRSTRPKRSSCCGRSRSCTSTPAGSASSVSAPLSAACSAALSLSASPRRS